MRFAPAISIVLVALLCWGCQTARSEAQQSPTEHARGSLIGEWTTDGKEGKGSFVFNPDGTYKELFLDRMGVKSDISGTYTVQADKLTTTMTALDATSDVPAKEKKLQQLLPELRKVLNKPMLTTLVWCSPDEVKIVMGMNSELPLVRKKPG